MIGKKRLVKRLGIVTGVCTPRDGPIRGMRTSISYAFIGSLWCVHVVQLGGAISRSHYLSVLVYSDEQASEYPNIFGKFSLFRIFGIFGHTQSASDRTMPVLCSHSTKSWEHSKKVVLKAGFDPATIKMCAECVIP